MQTDRAAHEQWAKLSIRDPRAASVLHVIVAEMGDNTNALVASQAALARLAGCSVRTLQRALVVLRAERWIEAIQIGPTGTVCAYVVNSRVAWSGPRDGIRNALFAATVLASDDEQLNRNELGKQQPLHRIPSMWPGEHQLPSGPGLPPPSEPSIPGLEPDLPTTRKRRS